MKKMDIWQTVVIMMIVGTLTGCGSKLPPVEKQSHSVSDKSAVTDSLASDSLDGAARMEQCRRELDSLQKINGVVYQQRKADFDQLISGAGIYSGIRSHVSTYTQGTVDAYYRFKADKLCANISNEVLNELAKQ